MHSYVLAIASLVKRKLTAKHLCHSYTAIIIANYDYMYAAKKLTVKKISTGKSDNVTRRTPSRLCAVKIFPHIQALIKQNDIINYCI